MSWHNIKPRKADTMFSQYLRNKRGWRCEKCGKLCRVNGVEVAQLEASHYFGRVNESVRFDERNVRVLCSSCHRRMGGYSKSEDKEYDIWMKEILGEREYAKLKLDAHTYHKKDDKLIILWLKSLES